MADGKKTVGAGNYMPGAVVPTPKPTATAAPVLNPNNIAGLNQILNTKLGTVITPEINYSQVESLKDTDILALGQVLDKMGYTVKNSKKDIKRILADDPVISSIVKDNLNGGFIAIRDALLRDYTPVNVTATAQNIPSRTISKVDPVVFGEVINKVFEKVAMKKGTPEQVNALIAEFLPQMETGTLTETKKIKNPKTGKLESVTTVTPGMSQEKAAVSIEQRIKDLYPDEVDRASRIDFNSWLSKNTLGA